MFLCRQRDATRTTDDAECQVLRQRIVYTNRRVSASGHYVHSVSFVPHNQADLFFSGVQQAPADSGLIEMNLKELNLAQTRTHCWRRRKGADAGRKYCKCWIKAGNRHCCFSLLVTAIWASGLQPPAASEVVNHYLQEGQMCLYITGLVNLT